jgi:hypothetical protein
MASEGQTVRFAIFRGKDAKPDSEVGLMTYEDFTPVAADGLRSAKEAGFDEGHHLRVLFSTPGFSLVYLWFKSAFPLPQHVHNVDCLYYIVAGSLRLGHEELGAGDGFFVGRDVPYHYTPGPAGVELLEFRASDAFNIRVLANNRAFWDQSVQTIRQQHGAWLTEQRPSTMSRPGG